MRQVSVVQLTADLVFEPKGLVVKLLFLAFAFYTRNGEESEMPSPTPQDARWELLPVFYSRLGIDKF